MKAQKAPIKNQTPAILIIIWLAFLTGTLDAMAAIIWNFVLNKQIITGIIFKFIAYGAFGPAAMNGGSEMVVAGIVFHYIIAFSLSVAFYLLYPFFIKLFKNKYLIALIYGVGAWVIMNLIVIPLSKIGFHHIKPQIALTGMLILIICIGLPIALIADTNYKRGNLKLNKLNPTK